MNYTEIHDEILSELNRADLSSSVSAWVDRVYRDVMSRYEFPWMRATATEVTVVNKYRYTLPSDFGVSSTIKLVDGTNSRVLKEYLINKFDEMHPNPSSDSSDRPTECTVFSGINAAGEVYNELLVWPPSNGIGTLWYRYFIHAPILSGTKVPIIPLKHHRVLVLGGLKCGFARLREYEAASFWGNEYEVVIATMVREAKSLPNVERSVGEFQPSAVTIDGNAHLSPFVRRIT